MSFTENLNDYIQSPRTGEISELFWLPESKVGIHLMELDEQVLKEKAGPFRVQVKKIVEGLERREVDGSGLPVREPESLLALIKAWEALSYLNGDETFELVKNAIELQYVSRDHCYASLYQDVLEGKRCKREFRLHFKNTFIPFVVSTNGVLSEVCLELASVSKTGLLFKADERSSLLLQNAHSCGVSIFVNDLFRCGDSEVERELGGFKAPRNFWGEAQIRRMPTLNVDLSEVRFSKCHINLLGSEGPCSKEFVHVPFDAMEDIVLQKPSAVGESLRSKLEVLETDIKRLALEA